MTDLPTTERTALILNCGQRRPEWFSEWSASQNLETRAEETVDALAAVLDGLGEGDTLALHVVRGAEELDVVARFDAAEDTAGDVGDA